jgi:hypothetical protein
MRWNKREKVERPEYPKLVPLPGAIADAQAVLPAVQAEDPAAEVVEGAARGVFLRVFTAEGEAAAKRYSEARTFPMRDAD